MVRLKLLIEYYWLSRCDCEEFLRVQGIAEGQVQLKIDAYLSGLSRTFVAILFVRQLVYSEELERSAESN